MRASVTIGIAACLVLVGCSTTEQPANASKVGSPVSDKMVRLADDIKQELIVQNRMYQSRNVTYESGNPVTLEFEGSVPEFIRVMGEMGFDVRTVGKKPPFELYLNLHYDQAPIHYILEDAAAQLPDFVRIELRGERAIVFIYEG